MSEHQDTSGNDDQAPRSVPHTAAEWLAAIEEDKVRVTWDGYYDENEVEDGSWEATVDLALTVDGKEIMLIPGWVTCGYTTSYGADIDGSGNYGRGLGCWQVRDSWGDVSGRPGVVTHKSEDDCWSVIDSGLNNMSCDMSIPAADEDEADELVQCLDQMIQAAYDEIWIEPIGHAPIDWDDVDDIERVSKIVWDANTPEEARELAMEAGIEGEENLLKAEGLWFRDEWKHATDAFEELFPTYGEGSRATGPNDFLEEDFRSIVDGELSVREASDWWKDYGKRLHDVEEAIRDVGLEYDDDTDGDLETHVRQLENWLDEHTVEPFRPFVTPPECQGQALEYSYSLVKNRGRTFVIEREHDHCDGEIVHRLYEDGDPDGNFDPQNGAPKLGEFVGRVAVEKQTFPTPEELAAMNADRIRL